MPDSMANEELHGAYPRDVILQHIHKPTFERCPGAYVHSQNV